MNIMGEATEFNLKNIILINCVFKHRKYFKDNLTLK